MSDEVTMDERGVLTIPAPLRRRFGLEGSTRLTVEATDGGLVLRPVAGVPIEMYTDERIAEFTRHEERVGRILDGLDEETP